MSKILSKLHFGRCFTVISAEESVIRGGRFQRKGKVWRLTSFVTENIEQDNPAAAWKKVARALGKSEYSAVTGKIPGAAFFRFISADMDSRAQRGAVEFELSRQLLKVPEKYSLQFSPSGKIEGEADAVRVNAVVLPENPLNKFAAVMRKAGVFADEYIHPLMALDEEANTVYLPELDPDFGYVKDSWMPMPSEEICTENTEFWRQHLRKIFVLPRKEEFNARDYILMLLAAKVIMVGTLREAPDAFRVLPDAVRPVRFRSHIITSVILVIALVASLVWRFSITYGQSITEYRQITAETKRLKQRTTELKRSVKRNSKELKEMTRLVSMAVGEADAVAEFALLSETLPKDVLVSSIRWNETDIDIVMQCENSQLDLPALIMPLKYWKVGSLQQRQTGDSAVATINLKLIPYDAKVLK